MHWLPPETSFTEERGKFSNESLDFEVVCRRDRLEVLSEIQRIGFSSVLEMNPARAILRWIRVGACLVGFVRVLVVAEHIALDKLLGHLKYYKCEQL